MTSLISGRAAHPAHPPSVWRLRLTIAFVAVVFLLGGSARADVLSLILLRPIAAAMLVAMLVWAWPIAMREARTTVYFFIAAFTLTALHLVPLPPGIWTMLPGRGIVETAYEAAGADLTWLPVSLSPIDGWNQLFAMTVPAAAALAMLFAGRKATRPVLTAILALLLLSALFAFLQSIGPANSPLYLYRITNSGAAVGLFANRNHQAAALACFLPLLAAWASTVIGSKARQQAHLVMAAAAALTIFPLLFVTGSRGGLVLGLIGLALAWLVYHRPTEGFVVRHDLRARRILIGGAVAGVISVIVVAAFSARSVAIGRLIDSDSAGELRVAALPYLLDAIWAYFPFGSGAGSFVPVYKLIEPNALLSPAYFNHAHNDVVEVALEYGLPGMILMLVAVALWVGAVIRLRRHRVRNPDLSPTQLYGWAAASILLLLGMGSLFDYPLRVPSLAALAAIAAIWLSWAVADCRTQADGDGSATRKPLGAHLKPEH